MPTGHGEPAPSPAIWVDADACPVVIKEILFRAAERARVQALRVGGDGPGWPGGEILPDDAATGWPGSRTPDWYWVTLL